MTKEKIDFIQKNEKKKKNAIFVELLTSFVINALSSNHLVKLFTSLL